MAVHALELRPRTTLQLFDAAVRLCSRSLGVWAVTLPAGAALVAATFELVDAVAHHRALLRPAALFTGAWLFRALSQGAASHYLEHQLLESGEPSATRSYLAALKRAPALFFCAGYCLTLNTVIWCFSLGLGFFLLTSHLAAYAVVMKGRGSLLGLYGTCARLLGPARHTASTLRLCGLTQLVVGLNLHLFANGLLLVAARLLAFDVTFLSRFTSVDNPVWLAALAALTFSLFEPIRAASAALLLIDGRVRQEGLDLLTQLGQLPRRRPPRGEVAAVTLLALLLTPALARAQDGDDWAGTWSPGQPRPGQVSTAMGQRLRAVVDDCGLNARFTPQQLDAVDALPLTARAPLSRFVSRIERLAYDDEECDGAADELERGLKQISQVAQEPAAAATRDQARAVLERPEFAVDPPEQPKTDSPKAADDDGPSSFGKWFRDLLERFLKWLFEPDRERRASPSPQGDFGFATGLSNLVMVAAVALVAGVLLWVLLRGLKGRGDDEVEAEMNAVQHAPLEPDPMNALSRPPEGWAGLADELAKKGLFREAIRNLYLALLARLHRDGAIDYDPSKSNWDYFRGFKGPLTALTPFKELTRRFDFAWYGNLEVGPDSWATFRSITQPLLHTGAEGA